MSEKNLVEMLYAGPISVDIGYDFSEVPTAATTEEVFGALDLGGRISTQLIAYYAGESDDESDPPRGSVEMWSLLLVRMRDMLARCFVLGEMQISPDMYYSEIEEEERENLHTAMGLLDKDFYVISLETAIEAIRSREREYERMRGGLEVITKLMNAVKKHPFERITIGEMLERFKEEEGEDK